MVTLSFILHNSSTAIMFLAMGSVGGVGDSEKNSGDDHHRQDIFDYCAVLLGDPDGLGEENHPGEVVFSNRRLTCFLLIKAVCTLLSVCF